MYLNLRCIKVIQLHYFESERLSIHSCCDRYTILFNKYRDSIDCPDIAHRAGAEGTSINQESGVSCPQDLFLNTYTQPACAATCSIGHDSPMFACKKMGVSKKRYIEISILIKSFLRNL